MAQDADDNVIHMPKGGAAERFAKMLDPDLYERDPAAAKRNWAKTAGRKLIEQKKKQRQA
jgi:hypothetical protein